MALVIAQIRPRVSLATGSVLILLTLGLPIAYEGCGPNRTGIEVIQGKGIWPGTLTFIWDGVERGFYLAVILLAAFTLILALASLRRPQLLRKLVLLELLVGISGTFSFYVTADFFWVFLALRAENFLTARGVSEDTSVAVAAAVASLVLALCFRSKFLRNERWIVGLLALAILMLWTVVAALFLSEMAPFEARHRELIVALLITPTILFWLIPAGLWYRYGLSLRPDRRSLWLGIRSRIAQMYVPAALFDVLFFWDAIEMGIWGFVPFFVGIHLTSLGYLRLAPRSSSALPVVLPPSSPL